MSEDELFASEYEEDDADIELMSLLAAQTQHAPPPAPRTPGGPPRRFSVAAPDDLQAFRRSALPRQRPRVLETWEIDDVPMDDLLEQLATTAAALRRRKAA